MQLPPIARLAPRPLRPEALALSGIPAVQIEQHFAIYARYVADLNEIYERLEGPEAARRQTVASLHSGTNVVKLHEVYFEALNSRSGRPKMDIKRLIERDFGAWHAWQDELRGLAAQTAGWVIMAYDRDDARLHDFVVDSEDRAVWNSVPILALDVTEHAYAMCFGTNKAGYVDAWLQSVDWAVVEHRVKALDK